MEGDAAVARALYSADLLEQRTKSLPFPPVKDPAVTRERKAKYGDGTYVPVHQWWMIIIYLLLSVESSFFSL